ncbi:MAG: YdjY domain-containing protein [Finegoldia sp.]|nr:YdjY domain-containing protein [Finegoldia sp.]
MKKLSKALLALMLGAFAITGCSNQNAGQDQGQQTEQAADNQANESQPADNQASEQKNDNSATEDALKGVSEQNPIFVDKENKTVTIYTTFNGKFLTEPTRHLAIYNQGKLADMAYFSSYASTEDFYKGLEEIGATPGNNMTADNAATTKTEGTDLKVTLFWNGNENGTDVNDAIQDSNGNKINMRFSGNKDNSKEFNTGCISCLDSCFVGITSNATYSLGAIEERGEVVFKANADKLPQDKEAVALVYSVN